MIPLSVIFPELVLIVSAAVLFLIGVSNKISARRLVPIVALLALVFVFFYQFPQGATSYLTNRNLVDSTGTFRIDDMAHYIKMIAAGVGVLFVLLSWPSNHQATANNSLSFGNEAGEFFGLMLLSISGIFLVAGANDIILLFLGVELASLPTYIMVSISRPLPSAQEAGVKYFFLGAMSAALMLFGFSYLYGTTGLTNIGEIAGRFAATININAHDSTVTLTPWQMLAAIMVIMGLAFKMAAVPLHFYAADVYQGAATPVTALLSFVPKTSGFVALIKILYAFGGTAFAVPSQLVRLLWIIAVLTMTVGNVLGLLQSNIKRVLAYSSIAHSGYMLTAITALVAARGNLADRDSLHEKALSGVLFYLAAYGIMNAGAFGVLMLLPAKPSRKFGETPLPESDDLPEASAETYEDIAGAGRRHVGLGLAMAVSCFSLIGLPMTVGFFGKVYLIAPALKEGMIWLVVLTMINAAISAAYYLKIVGTMFLRAETGTSEVKHLASAASGRTVRVVSPSGVSTTDVSSAGVSRAGVSSASVSSAGVSSGGVSSGGISTEGLSSVGTMSLPPLGTIHSFPTLLAVILSTVGTLFFGCVLPATADLGNRAKAAAVQDHLPLVDPTVSAIRREDPLLP